MRRCGVEPVITEGAEDPEAAITNVDGGRTWAATVGEVSLVK